MSYNTEAITDDYMRHMIGTTKEYSIVILNVGPNIGNPSAQQTIWEHVRRNFALREEGLLSIVCPVNDGSGVAGVGIFNAMAEKTKEIMDGDPAVQEGIFTYTVHAGRSFPGDELPG